MFSSFLLGIITSIVGQFILIILAGFGFYLTNKIFKKKFKSFFGIKKRLIVFLSNWFDKTKATNGSLNTLGFVTEKELNLQNFLRDFFNQETALYSILLSKLKGKTNRERTDIQMIIKASPLEGNPISNDSPMLIIGSSVANYARSFFVNKEIAKVTFEKEKDQIPNSASKIISNKILVHTDNVSHTIEGHDSDYINAFIERSYYNDRSIIFCCGFTGESTDFVTRYLINNWQEIDKRHHNKPFIICIGVQIIKGKENEKYNNNFVILYENNQG